MTSSSRLHRPRKKSSPSPSNASLFDIPNLHIDDISDDEIDENTLESELEALMRGEIPVRKQAPKPKVTPVIDIEKLAADILKEDDESEEDDSDLLKDEELLNELQGLSPETTEEDLNTNNEFVENTAHNQNTNNSETSPAISSTGESLKILLTERLNLYNDAIKAAQLLKDNSKIRRYSRAVKTLENLLKTVNTGHEVNQEDIPPVVSIPKPSTPTSQSCKVSSELTKEKETDESLPNPTAENNKLQGLAKTVSLNDGEMSLSSQLSKRRDQYKAAALEAKRAGNKELAIKFMKTAKCFDSVIVAANNNEPVDLSSIPPPPPSFDSAGLITQKIGAIPQKRAHEQVQNSSPIEIAALAAAKDEEATEIFSAPPPATSVLEALKQRLAKYSETKAAAESEGNSGKARRLQRIVKLYETAIKDYTAGKKIDFDELPTPPGFAPIPLPKSIDSSVGKEKPSPTPSEVAPSKVIPVGPQENINPHPSVKKPKERERAQRTNTTSDKQLEFLLTRQKLFREAALQAKKNSDMQLAKEYLKMSKGFDSMIEAVRCGLPIDSSSIPTPPQLESDFEIIDIADCEEKSDLSSTELFENLEKDLLNQLDICSRNKQHFMRLGDVTSVSKFEKLGLESKKDHSLILHLKKSGESVPKFHYETRLFSMVICNSDLADNELEVIVTRGINLPGKPDDLDSFIRLEFPIPNETPQRAKTHTVRDTNNPVYDESFKFEINRKSRSQIRLFKRHSLKLECWCKGGFLRSDTLLGTALVKLQDLESKCTVHDSFNLMENRKNCGGKLEVKVRIRDPLLVKQVEQVREKWLVIGS